MIALVSFFVVAGAVSALRIWYLQRWIETQSHSGLLADGGYSGIPISLPEELRLRFSRRDCLLILLAHAIKDGVEVTDRLGLQRPQGGGALSSTPGSEFVTSLLDRIDEISWSELRQRSDAAFVQIEARLQSLGLMASREEWLWQRSVTRLLPAAISLLGFFKSRTEWFYREERVHAGLDLTSWASVAPEVYGLVSLIVLAGAFVWPREPNSLLSETGHRFSEQPMREVSEEAFDFALQLIESPHSQGDPSEPAEWQSLRRGLKGWIQSGQWAD
jgi:hypothetical protein